MFANLISGDCPLTLGMESGVIQDNQISASSFDDKEHMPQYGRLRNHSYWRANENDLSPWFQVSFDQSMIISAVAIQGVVQVAPEDGVEWVEEFRLVYSDGGSSWQSYSDLLNGNDVSDHYDDILRVFVGCV